MLLPMKSYSLEGMIGPVWMLPRWVNVALVLVQVVVAVQLAGST